MAKAKSTSVETPGAVAAAHDYIEDAVTKIGKHHDTLVSHIDSLQGQVGELQSALAQEKEQHTTEVTRMRESRDREVNDLQRRLAAAETKLAKVIQTLA